MPPATEPPTANGIANGVSGLPTAKVESIRFQAGMRPWSNGPARIARMGSLA